MNDFFLTKRLRLTQRVSPQVPELDAQKATLLFERVHAVIVVAIVVYIAIFYWAGSRFSAGFLALSLMTLNPLIVFLARKKNIDFAKLLLLFVCSVDAFICSFGIGHQGLIQFYCLPFMVMSLLLFKGSNRSYVYLGCSFAVVSGVMISIGAFLSTWSNLYIADVPATALSTIDFLGASAMMIIFLAILIADYNENHFQTCNLLKVIESVKNWQKATMDSAQYAMIAAPASGNISIFSKGAERMLGYTAEEMIGKTPAVFHDLDEVVARAKVLTLELGRTVEPGFDVFVAKALAIGPDTNEWTYIRKDGSRFPVRLCITAIYDEDNQHIGFLGIAEDITEQKRIENELEAQRRTLIESSKMSSLGEMASGVAHEINNPLTIIQVNAGLVRKKLDDEVIDRQTLKQKLTKIETTADRIARIVRGLRSFSRNAEADPMEIVKISDVVEDTLELCQERFKSHSIDFRVNAVANVQIECRAAEISQVLMNLLNNAHDAAEDQNEKWVELDVAADEQFVRLSVTDSGSGITPETIQKMMEPFYTTKVVGKGTGLGLSISKGITEAHHGTLIYDSRSKNTRFILSLPLKQPQVIHPTNKAA